MLDYTYEDYKEYVEEHLLDFIPDIDHKSITLYEAMKYSLTAGGKRIRPVLLLAACDFCGGKIEEALPYACAIEYIHTYSLIHDDLPCMDDDDLRRGVPTNHKIYGEAMATLAGDGLLSVAFEAMNRDMLLYFDDAKALNNRVRAMYEISKGAGVTGMVAGQVADVESENKSCSVEMLEYIDLTKTSALLVAAVRAGARIAGCDADTLNDLTAFAENLGLAFQIRDDILDVEGSVEDLGKTTGKDEAQNKCTYPALFGMDEAKERLEELTQAALDSVAHYYDNAELFTKLAQALAIRGN